MCRIPYQQARTFLNPLVGRKLRKAFRLLETELFCFGFGETVREVTTPTGERISIPRYALHVQCPFAVDTEMIDGISATEAFRAAVRPLIGFPVDRLILGTDQVLELYLGRHKLVLYPYETGEDAEAEAWRFFEAGTEELHLVAARNWVSFQ